MTSIRNEAFGGMIPLVDDRLLPKDAAAYATDCWLQAGYLAPFSAYVEVAELDPSTRYAFRIPRAGYSVDNMSDSYWLEFQNANTTVVRYPVIGEDDDGRYYWADGVSEPGYTTGTRIEAGDPNLVLGIPAPTVAPGVVPAGGVSVTTETRAYVYTWVSLYGEEGQPSPATVATGKIDDTWAITLTAPGMPETDGRELDLVRIYRTVTSAQGVAVYYFVAEQDISDTTYNDTIPSSTVVLNAQLQSTNWSPPPADLVQFLAMPNGMIASFRNNEVWFCEPYRPHAWPAQYTIGVESPIVGLGVYGQTLVITTAGQPYQAVGIHPSSMALGKVATVNPCSSQGSIVSAKPGVLFSSTNGLVLIGPGGSDVVTKNMIRKDQWSTLLNVKTLRGAFFDVPGAYYCFAGVVDGCFQEDAFQTDAFQQDDYTGTRQGALITLDDQRMNYMVMTSDDPIYNVMQDVWTGEVLIIRDSKVFHVDLRQSYPREPYLWRSKIFQQDFRKNYGAVRVFFEDPPGPAPDAATYFRFYADNRMIYQEPLTASGQVIRLPSGLRYDFIQWEIEGELIIWNVQLATSVRELRQV